MEEQYNNRQDHSVKQKPNDRFDRRRIGVAVTLTAIVWNHMISRWLRKRFR